LKFYPELNDSESFAESHFDEIANKIESDSRFEVFPPHVLDAIRAGEIDEYKIRLTISKAPQDVGSYGSHTNVAKLLDIIENEIGLEVLGSGSANISILAPVESLEELAKYPYVERIIGKDFGIKHVSEDKTRGIIKYSYDENVYDIPYNVTNAKVKIFTEFGVRLTTNDYGILQMSYPTKLTDNITNAYGNVTLTSFIENAGNINDGFQLLGLNDEYISFQWDFIHDDFPTKGLGFFSTITTSGSTPIIEDVQDYSLKHQMRMGVTYDEIKCKEGLKLIFKPSDNSPACVKPSTAEKLIQRGWVTKEFSRNSIAGIISDISQYHDQQIRISGEFSRGIMWPELTPPVCFNVCAGITTTNEYAVAGAYWVLSDKKGNSLAVKYDVPSPIYNSTNPNFGQWQVPEEFLGTDVMVTGTIKPDVRSFQCACMSATSGYLLLNSIDDIQLN